MKLMIEIIIENIFILSFNNKEKNLTISSESYVSSQTMALLAGVALSKVAKLPQEIDFIWNFFLCASYCQFPHVYTQKQWTLCLSLWSNGSGLCNEDSDVFPPVRITCLTQWYYRNTRMNPFGEIHQFIINGNCQIWRKYTDVCGTIESRGRSKGFVVNVKGLTSLGKLIPICCLL